MDKVFGFDSYCLRTDETELYITKKGGQMAPVSFFINTDSPVQPYYINPWCDEPVDRSQPVLLQALRGDFFCFPFGGDNNTEDFHYECHGPTANDDWKKISQSADSITLEMDFADKKAKVQTKYQLKEGHSCIYLTHRITDCDMKVPYGHHAILDASGKLLLSTSPITKGIVTFESDEPYGGQEYRILKGHGTFDSLEAVPSGDIRQKTFDVTEFPAREGFVDIVQVINDRTDDIGYSCVVCPERGYMWYSFKKISDFPTTLIWMENKGRHGAPWSGRNVCVAVEDAMSCFAYGAGKSASDNELTEMGVQTCRDFSGKETVINFIEGVARVPSDFGKVCDVRFSNDSCSVQFADVNGKTVSTDIDLSHLDRKDI